MEVSKEIDLINTLLPFTGILFLIVMGVIVLNYQFRKNLHKQQLEAEELKSKHQLNILKVTIQTQEDERKRIASDLHDELGALLSISRMQLVNVINTHQDQDNVAVLNEQLNRVKQQVEDALATTRRISHQLMPAELVNLGLIKATKALADKAENTGELTFILNLPDSDPPLSWATTLGVYRIYSELINNTLKHSGANKVWITMQKEHTCFECSYADNGKGLNTDETSAGLGLKSLEGRANALGAKLEIGNHKQGGFRADLKIPIQSS